MQLHFRAAAGADSPVTLTLFNPHPVERVAFKAGSCMQRTTLSIATYSKVTRSGVAFVGHLLHHRLQQVPSGSQSTKISRLLRDAADQDDRQQHVPGVAQQRLPGGGRNSAGAGATPGHQGGPVQPAARGGVPP